MTGRQDLGAPSDLIGRDGEGERLGALIDHLQDGGGALLVSGEAGIGKSALLDHAGVRARALGMRTLATAGVESEAELAFAGLHQLLRPVFDLMELLPDPQRHALEAAFGISREFESDPFLVALAAYQLVCEADDLSPLVLIADDAHWLDRSSLGVLSFIARRLETEPIALVAALRAGYATPLEEARLPVVELDRLSAAAAAELLDRNAPDLHPVRRARVLAEAAGNPLALVELARSLPPVGDGDIGLSEAPPSLTGRLERAFAARLDDLPEETRVCLLAAALDGRASVEEVVSCAALLRHGPVAVSALDPAAEADLIDVVRTGVRFRHPLIRSAVRQAALPARVLAMYGALADVVADPERRLWHQAMSAVGFDEQVADALEEHSAAARRRGAVTVAAAALERAAALTADPHTKGERLVRAAEVAYELGLVDAVNRLLGQALPLEVGSLEAARLAWLQQMISGDVWFEQGAAKTFVTIARQIRGGGDADMAVRSLVPIAHRCWWTRPRARTRQFVVDTAESIGVPEDDPRLLAVIALAHPEVTGPSVLRRIALIRLPDVADPVAAMHVGIAAEKAGDFATGVRFLARALEGLREQGRLGPLTQALVHYAWVATYTGDWRGAAAAASEAALLARDTRQPQYGLTGELVAALVAARRGSEPDAGVMLEQPERTLAAMNGGPLLAPAHLARGAEALGDGRHEDAFRHLWPVFDEDATAFHRFMRWPAVLDLVEAGVRSGQTERVAEVIAGLEVVDERSAPPVLGAGLTCAAPLMADDRDAEALFVAALDSDLAGYAFLRARTLFSFGCWLRRQRRSADSRAPLREAVDLFDGLGATRWSTRARQELRATGETIGRRSPDARDRLTAQELQIAQLAAQGLSNREIGQRMFLSHRTIGSHLYRIFPKLEITSRGQLRDALAGAAKDGRSPEVVNLSELSRS
jgi:DNA-binding CsgD family transcriptional regulator